LFAENWRWPGATCYPPFIPVRSRLSWLVSTIVVLVAGCASQSTTDLLTLTDLDPRQITVGDHVELVGVDLPSPADIRRLTVTFRGTLSRPGKAPCSAPVELSVSDPPADATTVDATGIGVRERTYAESSQRTLRLNGNRRIEFLFTEAMYRQLIRCPGQRGDVGDIPHATLALGGNTRVGGLQGITVQVEGLTSGRVLSGTLRGAVIDLHAPAAQRVAIEARAEPEARRALDQLGIVLSEVHPTEGGLRVAAVRPESAADRAGLQANDVLVRLDGLALATVADVLPAPDAREATLSIVRGDVQDERVISLEGLGTARPADTASAAGILLASLFALAFFLAPRPATWTWLVRRSSDRLRAAIGVRGAAFRGRLFGLLSFRSFEQSHGSFGPEVERIRPFLVIAAALLVLAAIPTGPSLARMDLDLTLWLALAVTAERSGRWIYHFETEPTRDFALAVRGVVRAIWIKLPVVFALAAVVIQSGGLRARAVVAAQAGAPWQWNAVRMPASTALFVLYAAGFALAASDNVDPRASGRTPVVAMATMLEWTGLGAAAALGTTLFLGGWTLPWVSLTDQQGSVALQMVGGFLYAIKSAVLLGALATWRWYASRGDLVALAVRAWPRLSAIVAVPLLVALLWAMAVPWMPERFQFAVSFGTFLAVAGMLVGATTLRVRNVAT